MKIEGIPVSSGLAMYNAYKLNDNIIEVNKDLITNTKLEIASFHDALKRSVDEITVLKEKASKHTKIASLQVFSSHLLIVKDPLIIKEVEELIKDKSFNAAYAYKTVIEKFVHEFNSMKNKYMSERSIDIIDVSNRVLRKIIGIDNKNEFLITKEVILIANSITPSEVLSINTKFVKGIILKNGGITSHSSIMIKNIGIPLIIGVSKDLDEISNSELVIMDGQSGVVTISPTSDEIFEYIELQDSFKKEQEILFKLIDKETTTRDGIKLPILANINSDLELESALKNGAEGIGLLRTEFMYLEAKEIPTESELFESYSNVINAFPHKSVMIRTFDFGEDKIPKYIKLNHTDKLRGLALALSNEKLFKTQIKALLKANTSNNLSIMLPMVGSVSLLRKAVQLVDSCKEELCIKGISVNKNYKLGIMVEEMNVVRDIATFAKEVDFFSIGTNDLLESFYSIDRLDSKSINNQLQMSKEFLKVINDIIEASKDASISTSMCGEMACNIEAIPALVKLGINSLSMSPRNILKIRKLISEISSS